MKLKFKRNYLDFKEGKEYNVEPLSTAKYIISMSIAKEVVEKDGTPKKAKEPKSKPTE